MPSMALSKQYPGSVTRDEIKRECPTFGDKVCPFTKLAVKGAAGKCPAFEKECPFANCMTVGQFEAQLGEMRESHKNTPSGEAASLQYLRAIHRTAKDKEVDVGSACPFFQSKGGCPFARDTTGKAIFSPDYIVTPNSVTLNDTMFKCPAFGKGMCPYAILVTKCKGLAGNCPAFKEGCPFKNCKSVGEFVEKLTQMRDQMKNSTKGKGAASKFFQELLAVTTSEQKKLGNCPFNVYVCPFSHDAQGKPISFTK